MKAKKINEAIKHLPGRSMEEMKAEAKAQLDKKRKSIQRNDTVQTNPLGLTPEDKSDLNLKTLTGS